MGRHTLRATDSLHSKGILMGEGERQGEAKEGVWWNSLDQHFRQIWGVSIKLSRDNTTPFLLSESSSWRLSLFARKLRCTTSSHMDTKHMSTKNNISFCLTTYATRIITSWGWWRWMVMFFEPPHDLKSTSRVEKFVPRRACDRYFVIW